jgi:hypothetical protein
MIFFEIKNPEIIARKMDENMPVAGINDAAEYLTLEFCFSLR